MLDLDVNEKKVYSVLSVSGQLSLPEIIVGTGLTYNNAKEILEGLIQKGLVKTIPGLVDRYAVVLPLRPVAESLQQKAAKVETFPEKLEETVLNNLAQLKNDIEVLIQHLTEVKEESYTRGTNTLKGKKTEVKEAISNDLSDLINKLNTEMDSEKNNVILKIRSLQTALKETIASIITELDEINEGHKKELTNFMENVKTKTSDKIALLPQEPSALSLIPEFNNELTSQEDKAFQLNQGFVNETTQSLAQQYEKLLELLNTLSAELSNHLERLKTSVGNWQNNTLEFLNKFNNDLSAGISRIETSFNSGIGNLKEKLSSISVSRENNVSQLREAANKFYAENSQQIQTTNESVKNGIESVANSFTNKATFLKSQWENALSGELNEAKQFQEGLKQEFDALIQQLVADFTAKTNELYTKFNQNFNESIEKSISSRRTLLDQTVEELLADISKTKEELNTQFSTVIAEISSKLDGLKTEFDTVIAEITKNNAVLKEKELVALEEFSKAFDELKKEFLESLNTMNEALKTSLAKQSEDLVSAIENSKAGTTQSINEQTSVVNSALEALDTEKEKLFSELEEIHKSSIESINSGISMFRSSLLQAHAETINSLSELLNGYVSELEQSLNTMMTNYDGFTEDKKSKLNEKQASVTEDLDMEASLIEAVFSQMKTDLDEFSAKSISKIDEMLDEGINRLSNVLRGALEEFLTITKDTIQKNYEGVESRLSITLREAIEITEEIKEETLKVANGLAELSQEQASALPPKIMSSVIVGEDAIKEYMKQMVGRVKRGITFLAPEKSFIPVEAILSLPMTAQVTIVTRLDKIADREWIETLFKAKANVIIRQLSERTGTGTLPNFIGCEREGEEILLGTIDEDSKETVAIVSMSSYFTKILGNIVIAEYARGRSVQLQRSEFGL